MSIFVVADTEGHAVAVVPTMPDAYEAAGMEAHRVIGELAASGADDLMWTIETRERSPQWTRLSAFTSDRTSMVTYVVTEIEADASALGASFIQPAARAAATIVGTAILPPAPAAPPAPAEAAVETLEPVGESSPAPEASPEPQAAPEAAETGMPVCEAKHTGCAGHVEDQEQLNLCSYKRLPPMCRSCLKTEVAATKEPDPEPAADESVPVVAAE